jgi:hypothetical protein
MVVAFAQVNGFLTVKGKNIVDPKGEKLFIRGTNLGNWLRRFSRTIWTTSN